MFLLLQEEHGLHVEPDDDLVLHVVCVGDRDQLW